MHKYQLRVQFLLSKLRYKYRLNNDEKHTAILNKIMARSYNVVYTDHKENYAVKKAIECRKAKKKRTNKYLNTMFRMYPDLQFVTLTFSNDYISSTEETKKKYALRWLEQNAWDYWGNVDFGGKNGRIHYHAVVDLKDKITAWNYGFYNIKPIKKEKTNVSRLSSYVIKLTNHGNKLTTGKSFHKRKKHGFIELDPNAELPF